MPAIERVVTEGEVVVSVAGDVDSAAAAWFEVQVLACARGAPASVALDLRRVTFLDSTGLTALLRIAQRVRDDGGSLEVVPGPAVHRLLELTGLLAVLTVRTP